MNNPDEKCIYCGRNSDEVPLIALRYRFSMLWICPQHLPVLIHHPEKLADKLPGAASFGTPENHPHD